MKKSNLILWMLFSLVLAFSTSCQKDNYDISDTVEDEFNPTTTYPGEDNQYGFAFQIITSGSTNTIGGIAVNNNITLVDVDLLKWKITSTVQDGDLLTQAETTFFTPDMNGGTFDIDELRLKFQNGPLGDQEFIWQSSDIEGGIEVSGLSGTPDFVSGNIGVLMPSPGDTTFNYIVEFSKIPFN